MIPILADSAWREFRSAPATKGQNHTTHQALIADHDGHEHKCFVKASPQGNPMAFAEGLAWLVATRWTCRVQSSPLSYTSQFRSFGSACRWTNTG